MPRPIKIVALELMLSLSIPFILHIFLGKYLRPAILLNYCVYVLTVLSSMTASLLIAITLYEMLILYKKTELKI